VLGLIRCGHLDADSLYMYSVGREYRPKIAEQNTRWVVTVYK